MAWWSMWLAMIWALWLHRNAIVFRDELRDVDTVFDNAKLRAWQWLATRYGEWV